MKKLTSFALFSTAAALCLGAASAFAGFVTPRVPPAAPLPTSKPAGGPAYSPMGVGTVRTVTTVHDGGPGSLRQAIADSAPGDSINFALTLPASIALSNTLVITQDLTVTGPGPDQLTIMRSAAAGTPGFRVFDVEAGVVALTGITIRNGIAFSGTYLHDNLGGGILNRAALTLSNCVVTANSAPTTDWGAKGVSIGFGAGIFTYSASLLTLINSTVSDNQASAAGGGVCTYETTSFWAQRCTISGNFAFLQGGGLNFQGRDGAMQNCTISGNATSDEDPSAGGGSAICNVAILDQAPPTLTLSSCTVANNSGTTNGAFTVAAYVDTRGITNRILSTLVANNPGGNFFFYGPITMVSLGHNLDNDGTSGLANGANGDLVGTLASPINPQLGPLQNNGGLTLTMALLPGSPAIGTGACEDASGTPLLVDQRGFPRPQSTACDIGAFEYQPLNLTCPPGVVVEFATEAGAVATYSAVVTSTCPNVTVVYTPPSGSLFPIGVTPVLVTATDGCSNLAQCSFNVTVLGAEGVKSDVLAELVALRASLDLDQPFTGKFDGAIQHLQASLSPAYWIDQTHLQPKSGNAAMNEEKLAANDLDGIAGSKKSPVDPAILQGFIDRIVKSDRLLATVSIEDAANAGLNAKKVAQDLDMVAKGDAEAAAGHYANAIEQYRNAWRHALQLQLQASLTPEGSSRVQFIGNTSKSYVIEASADTVTWAALGTCKADAEGNVQFIDTKAAAGGLRFYRALEQ